MACVKCSQGVLSSNYWVMGIPQLNFPQYLRVFLCQDFLFPQHESTQPLTFKKSVRTLISLTKRHGTIYRYNRQPDDAINRKDFLARIR